MQISESCKFRKLFRHIKKALALNQLHPIGSPLSITAYYKFIVVGNYKNQYFLLLLKSNKRNRFEPEENQEVGTYLSYFRGLSGGIYMRPIIIYYKLSFLQ